MRPASRSTLLVAAPTFLAVATLGFVLGHSRVVHWETMREASTAVGSLEYSAASGWRKAAGAPPLPDLSIARPFVLAPAGDGAHAGLLVGRLESGANPLPTRFLAGLRTPPSTEVVYLANTQAYRYSHVSFAGSAEEVTLYTIPESVRSQAAIVCYTRSPNAGYLHECERIAATFIMFNSASGEALDLTPDVSYMRQISTAVERVDRLRRELRPGIRQQAPRDRVAELARSLAGGLTSVVESLSAVPPPLPAAPTHAALLDALRGASNAYSTFAGAVVAGSTADYNAARAQIYHAEAGVNTALLNFTLLGYS